MAEESKVTRVRLIKSYGRLGNNLENSLDFAAIARMTHESSSMEVESVPESEAGAPRDRFLEQSPRGSVFLHEVFIVKSQSAVAAAEPSSKNKMPGERRSSNVNESKSAQGAKHSRPAKPGQRVFIDLV